MQTRMKKRSVSRAQCAPIHLVDSRPFREQLASRALDAGDPALLDECLQATESSRTTRARKRATATSSINARSCAECCEDLIDVLVQHLIIVRLPVFKNFGALDEQEAKAKLV